MNAILSIKLPFSSESNPSSPGPRNLGKTKTVTSQELAKLANDLDRVLAFYSVGGSIVANCLVDAVYKDVAAKSNRIKDLFRKGSGDSNETIVGARFGENGDSTFHIITHYVSRERLKEAIRDLKVAGSFVENELSGEANSVNFSNDKKLNYASYPLPKSRIRDVIIDCSVLSSFALPNAADKRKESPEASLITFFATELSVSEICYALEIRDYYPVGRNTISVRPEVLNLLLEKVPYLISMVASDFSKVTFSSGGRRQDTLAIPSPKNEPTIGVIDTLFDKNAYFSSWVDYRPMLDEFEKYTPEDEECYAHGTSVSSLIVDGPSLNPSLDDGCGRFKVRHFGVCKKGISPSRLITKIEDIIRNNLDVHVWNLSLGTREEASRNFVSYDGAKLDELQAKYDVIFVVAGTNDDAFENGKKRVGSPADSLCSLVVNSVRKDLSPASYSRSGPILSFFRKPDVSYYGGDVDQRIRVFSSNGMEEAYGTSFAAPLIARKLAYLIDVLGISRECAKALLIDSAASWAYKGEKNALHEKIGFGVVPIRIEDILSCPKDEIRFLLSGTSAKYKTSNYRIPVPKGEDNRSPYIARAALCYFPPCDRDEGVDYTQRELSLRFGIVFGSRLLDVNENLQDEEGGFVTERKARQEFRKWENTKFISSLLKKNRRGKKLDGQGNYGIVITSKERQRVAAQTPLKFGAVVTLKNIKGENRIEEFKSACLIRGYIVKEIKIETNVDIYNLAQSDIDIE